MLKIDTKRIHRYCLTIRKNIEDIHFILNTYSDQELLQNRHLLKALKYSLIEIAEAIANILQHLLARLKGEASESYLELVEKTKRAKLIDPKLLSRLTFFFKFRSFLIHRYWEVDDQRVLRETRNGYKDFEEFMEAIEKKLSEFQREG